MKSSVIRSSLSSLITGEHGGIVSTKPKLTFSDFRGCWKRNISYLQKLANPLLQGNEILTRSAHSCSDEDDAFSELGSPLSQVAGTALKLVTEKPELFKKTDLARKVSFSKFSPGGSSTLSKNIHLKHGKPVQALGLMPDDDSGVLELNINHKNAFICKSSRSIVIEKVPSIINLHQLKEAVSMFGEISNASMRSIPNELDCCIIEFESIRSTLRAISAGEITVGNFQLPICPSLSAPKMVTIRISNIGPQTSDCVMRSVCMSYGLLEGLAKTIEGEVDALFSVTNDWETLNLFKKINNTTIDNCKWSAVLSNSSLEVTTNNEDTRKKLKEQFSNHIADLNKHFALKKLHAEDLETLYTALVDLEPHPATIETLHPDAI